MTESVYKVTAQCFLSIQFTDGNQTMIAHLWRILLAGNRVSAKADATSCSELGRIRLGTHSVQMV